LTASCWSKGSWWQLSGCGNFDCGLFLGSWISRLWSHEGTHEKWRNQNHIYTLLK
jgi:hypothetical protein